MQIDLSVFGKPVCDVKCGGTHCRIKFVDNSFLLMPRNALESLPEIRETEKQ